MLRNAAARARRDDGFTLIELVVVVAILATLAGVLIPMVSHEVDDARHARALTDLRTVATAFNSYRTHSGVWPSNSGGANPTYANLTEDLRVFTCLYTNSQTVSGWNGPYLNVGDRQSDGSYNVAGTSTGLGFRDPWDRLYQVRWYAANGQMGAGGGIVLVCLGPNGVLDTSAVHIAEGQASGDDALVVVTRRL